MHGTGVSGAMKGGMRALRAIDCAKVPSSSDSESCPGLRGAFARTLCRSRPARHHSRMATVASPLQTREISTFRGGGS